MALPLLPKNEVETSFFNLRATADPEVKKQLRDLFLYFDDYWLNTIPVEMWNVHGCHYKTNNICEGTYTFSSVTLNKILDLGFHSRLNRRIERAHGNIWSFIRCIISEECHFQHLLAQINTGAQRRQATFSTNCIQKRIDTLTTRYNNGEIDANALLDNLSLLIGKKK